MHRPFTDEDFKKFVLSEELIAQYDALARTLAAWKIADLRSSAFRVLPYLPAQAIIHVKAFPIIKPQHNSFVFDMDKDPAIFLYLNPAISPQEFQNTVAHEMHHIGLSSTDAFYQKKVQLLPPPAQKAALWMGAFGEGLAVLAAAGGPDLPPNQFSQPDVRLNWQRGMDTFNTDLVTLDRFFLDILDGRLKGDAADEKAFTFFGEIQGPWYTVGYNMATIIEKRFGRQSLIECMLDPRLLLQRYNQAAQERNSAGRDHLALWSAELLNAVLPGDSPASTR